jgi:para-nitrobenzyl esterase
MRTRLRLLRAALVGGLVLPSALAACSDDRAAAAPSDAGQLADGTPAGDAGADAATCGADVTPGPGVVVTDRGGVRGVTAGDTWAFLGVPYAAPPLGALRWTPPQDLECAAGLRDANAFSPKCPQLDADGNFLGDEDCLYLNVWTPADAPAAAALPVLFFIHGGGHVQGSTSEVSRTGEHIYDGAALAAQARAVVVTINYRLGALGFATAPALTAGDPRGVSGNYGTLDAIAALGWVQRNIAAFGGDPDHVLVFGESAGAVQTCVLVASPLAAGLFSAAAVESGGCVANEQSAAEAFAATFFDAAGCGTAADVAACLRSLSAEAVVKALPQPPDVAGKSGGYASNIDGQVLPGKPLDLIRSGAHNHVPILVGVNSDETSRSVPQLTLEEYRQRVYALARGDTTVGDLILARYPVADYGDSPRRAFVALTSDVKFICPSRTTARAAVAGQTEPVFRYFFTHAFQNAGATVQALGAWHGIELPYVFYLLDLSGYTPTAGEVTLADAIVGYWSRLASAGDPNLAGAPPWPAYEAATDPYLQLEDPIQAGTGVRTAPCDFWDSLIP